MKKKINLNTVFLLLSISLASISADTGFGISDVGTISSITKIEYENLSPVGNKLNQNYPNPFNPSTTIEFDLPKASDVRIEVYNTTGQKVQTLLNKKMSAGSHQVEFNAENLSSGVYFYKIEAGKYQKVRKMILLK